MPLGAGALCAGLAALACSGCYASHSATDSARIDAAIEPVVEPVHACDAPRDRGADAEIRIDRGAWHLCVRIDTEGAGCELHRDPGSPSRPGVAVGSSEGCSWSMGFIVAGFSTCSATHLARGDEPELGAIDGRWDPDRHRLELTYTADGVPDRICLAFPDDYRPEDHHCWPEELVWVPGC